MQHTIDFTLLDVIVLRLLCGAEAPAVAAADF